MKILIAALGLVAISGAALLTFTEVAHASNAGCFVRTYDRAHLAKHPDQMVKGVKLHLKTNNRRSYDYDFSLQFKVRGKNETLRTAGFCNHDPSTINGLKCLVECDGGGVNVVHRANDLMMYLDRIRVTTSCGNDVIEGGEDLSGGKDDREFRLDRVNESMCDAMTP